MIRFHSQYCQWIEEPLSDLDLVASRYLVSYSTRWENDLFPDDTFVDRNYRNSITTRIPSWSKTMNIAAKNLTISEALFTSAPLNAVHIPTSAELLAFNASRYASLGFSYIGRGYYYLSGKRNLAKRLRKIRSLHSRAAENAVVEILMANCKVGDVRFRYELFAPDTLSVFGWSEKGVVTVRNKCGLLFGGVSAGFVRSEVLLAHVAAFRSTWAIWIQRVLAVLMLLYVWSPGNADGRVWRLCLGGVLFGIVRFVVWRRSWLAHVFVNSIASGWRAMWDSSVEGHL
jgi:hypothetical protein